MICGRLNLSDNIIYTSIDGRACVESIKFAVRKCFLLHTTRRGLLPWMLMLNVALLVSDGPGRGPGRGHNVIITDNPA